MYKNNLQIPAVSIFENIFIKYTYGKIYAFFSYLFI